MSPDQLPTSPGTAFAVLVPSPLAGAAVEAARAMRIALEGGDLWLVRADGSRERLCAGHEVRRVLHVLRPGRLDHVLIVARERAWALPVPSWTPGLGFGSPALGRRDLLEVVGIAGLARCLGKDVVLAEGPHDRSQQDRSRQDRSRAGRRPTAALLADCAGVAQVVTIDPSPGPPRWFLAVRWAALGTWCGALAAIVITSAVASITRSSLALRGAGLAVAVTAALASPLVWWLAGLVLSGSRRERAGRGDEVTALFTPQPALPATVRFRSQARLLERAGDLAVRDAYGREAWLAGPLRGGITQAWVVRHPDRPAELQFAGQAGVPVVCLPLNAWAGHPGAMERLATALAGVGVRVSDRPGARPIGTAAPLGSDPVARLAAPAVPGSGLAQIDSQLPAVLGLMLAVVALRMGEVLASAVSLIVPAGCVVQGLGSRLRGQWLDRRGLSATGGGHEGVDDPDRA